MLHNILYLIDNKKSYMLYIHKNEINFYSSVKKRLISNDTLTRLKFGVKLKRHLEKILSAFLLLPL